jgi:predicted neutral ceramidase superfamily lipid hydrolase
MNVAYGLPLLCKVLSPIPFSRGPFHLGRFSTYIDVIGIIWVIITVVLFVLPTEHPVTATNMNYTSLVFGAAVLTISFTYIFSARYWFKGPLTNLPTTIEQKPSENAPT